MPTRNVDVPEHLDSFIASEIEAGHYRNSSEVVCKGLRLLEIHEAGESVKLHWLRDVSTSAIASLDRGEGRSFVSVDEFANHVLDLGRKVSTAGNDEHPGV